MLSSNELHASKRARMHQDLDAPTLLPQQNMRPHVEVRAVNDSIASHPGFNPGNTNRFGTLGAPNTEASLTRAGRAEAASAWGKILTQNHLDGNLKQPVPNDHTMGTSRQGERVTVPMIIRQWFATNDEAFTAALLKLGDLMLVWMPVDDMRTQTAAFGDTPHMYTAATLPQVRSFEANHTRFADNFYKEVRVRRKKENESDAFPKYKVVDQNGQTKLGLRRPPASDRWKIAGVVANVHTDNNTAVVMISLCTQGPTLMRNYFSPEISIGTQVYLRELIVVPAGYDPTNDDDKEEMEAWTVKSIMAWPDENAIRIENAMIAGSTSKTSYNGLLATTPSFELVDMVFCNYLGMRHNVKSDSEPGTHFGPDSSLRYIGTVLDIYPSDFAGDSRSIDQTGYAVNSALAGMGQGPTVTKIFAGDVRINLSACMGMSPLEILFIRAGQSFE
jgi:hypothetical protein